MYNYTNAVSCVLPAPLLNGVLLNTNFQSTNLTEDLVITFQCDPGFSLVGAVTATCNNSGLWDPDPSLLECKFICVDTGVACHLTSGNIAAVTGGVIGGLLVVVLSFVVLRVIIIKKRKSKSKSEIYFTRGLYHSNWGSLITINYYPLHLYKFMAMQTVLGARSITYCLQLYKITRSILHLAPHITRK